MCKVFVRWLWVGVFVGVGVCWGFLCGACFLVLLWCVVLLRCVAIAGNFKEPFTSLKKMCFGTCGMCCDVLLAYVWARIMRGGVCAWA